MSYPTMIPSRKPAKTKMAVSPITYIGLIIILYTLISPSNGQIDEKPLENNSDTQLILNLRTEGLCQANPDTIKNDTIKSIFKICRPYQECLYCKDLRDTFHYTRYCQTTQNVLGVSYDELCVVPLPNMTDPPNMTEPPNNGAADISSDKGNTNNSSSQIPIWCTEPCSKIEDPGIHALACVYDSMNKRNNSCYKLRDSIAYNDRCRSTDNGYNKSYDEFCNPKLSRNTQTQNNTLPNSTDSTLTEGRTNWTEIVLICISVLVCIGVMTLVIYRCCKARRVNRDPESPLETEEQELKEIKNQQHPSDSETDRLNAESD